MNFKLISFKNQQTLLNLNLKFHLFILIYLILNIRFNKVNTISLKKFGVPGAVHNGSSIFLHCDFDLENDLLYSVKWYKNSLEFYRYLIKPNQLNPEHKVFPQLGIYIDLDQSNTTHVFLTETDLNTEGTFGCEVSTDAPSFKTVKAEKDLRIYVSPKKDLKILGIKKSTYNYGDLVNLTCKAGPSKPHTILAWFINKQQIKTNTNLPLNLSKQLIEINSNGLILTSLNISFRIENRFYQPHTDLIELVCESMLSTIYGVTYEELIIEQQNLNNKPSTYTAVREGKLDYSFQGEDYLENIEHYTFNKNDQEGVLNSPRIEQKEGSFSIGSKLKLNCTSQTYFPPVYLQWLINNREAISNVESISYFPNNQMINDFTGLIYDKFAFFNYNFKISPSILGLNIKINKQHYQTNDGLFRLRCVATHAKLISRKRKKLSLFSKNKKTLPLFAYNLATKLSDITMQILVIIILNIFNIYFFNKYN